MNKSTSVVAQVRLALQDLGIFPVPHVPDDQASSLSAAECQAMRQLLLLTQAEAAAWLSSPPVSERAWQYWEAGKRQVPEDVARALRFACAQRDWRIGCAIHDIHAKQGRRHVGVWYAKADDWKWTNRPVGLEWKHHNNVMAHLAGQRLLTLVGFDEAAYSAWSRPLPAITAAGEFARHVEWAATTLQRPADRHP